VRFLADESCDFAVVLALRNFGFDVATVSDVSPGVDDGWVIDLAVSEERMVITEDKDFGQLVSSEGKATADTTKLPLR
jgi:predicted nuclease of predicted toxin-antitoxin system